MKVFISWSGEKSRTVAELLSQWVECLFPTVEPFFSSDDIEKGEAWARRLSDVLAEYNFGIVVLTKQNKTSPWVSFEAGALSKIADKARVIPLLCDLSPGDLITSPLGLFQSEMVTQDGLFRLSRAINNQNEKKLDDDRLKDAFEVWWKKKGEPICAAALNKEKSDAPITHEIGNKDIMARLERLESSVSEGFKELVSGMTRLGAQQVATDAFKSELEEAQALRGKSYLNRVALGRKTSDIDEEVQRSMERLLKLGEKK